MRYISLFSGIEAASCAWEKLGWTPVAFSEIEPFACQVLQAHYPNVPNLGDICTIDWSEVIAEYGAVDLVVGGSPCQSFSVAGTRASLDGESRLMFEYIRSVQEIRPTWFLWENVPGALSVRDNAFGQLVGEMADLGYDLAWRVLDAQFFGVAQRRRRVFLVGSLRGGGNSAAVLFNAESVSGNTQTSKQKRRTIAEGSSGRSERGCEPIAIQGDGGTSLTAHGDGYNTSGVSYTLNLADRHSVVCMANDTVNAAVDIDLCGTITRGGSTPLVAGGIVECAGALCAHGAKQASTWDAQAGKLIVEVKHPR